MLQNNSQNSSKKFICENCDYMCSKKNDMTKHFSSQKHIRNKTSNNCNEQFVKKEFQCDLCSKKYNSLVLSALCVYPRQCSQSPLHRTRIPC